MPKAKRDSALYRRGEYWLDWDRKADGSLRSPFLAVFWYDTARQRQRSASTRTAELEGAKRFLDAFYLQRTQGQAVCPCCGQRMNAAAGHLVSDAIATYQLLHGEKQSSASAIGARLAHVVAYLAESDPAVTCERIDAAWIQRFREWAGRQPVHGRERSLSTIEGSVAQLAAAINHAYRRGDAAGPARFKPQPIRELNRTPHHRSDVAELAAMIRYCLDRNQFRDSAKMVVDARIRERAALHRFLLISVATLARPDAAHDVNLDPKRRQWNSNARVLSLNPAGRRQTKKYRATVPVAWQVAAWLDEAKSFFVGPQSVRKAWEKMAAELGLPSEGEAGMKLIRRSMADLLRQRLPQEAWGEIEVFLGHNKFDQVSDLYAPFNPAYLRRALAEIEAIIGEIEAMVPGAFVRTNVVQMRRA